MNREKYLTIASIGVISLFVLDKMIVAPLTNLWDSRAKEIDYLTKDVTKGRQLVAREEMLRERWAEMNMRALPEDRPDAESQIFTSIDEWSRSARLKTSRIIPNWRDEDDHSKLNFRVEATGDMEAVMRFLYDLDGERLAMRVESFDLGSLDKRGKNLALDLMLSGLELPKGNRQ